MILVPNPTKIHPSYPLKLSERPTKLNNFHLMLFFLLLMLWFRSVCHQFSNQADKLDLPAIFIISRRFAHLFKWASSGQCFLTTYNMQLINNKKQW